MGDFFDGKLFGAASVGVLTLATSYHAGASTWALALPLLLMTGYWFIFRDHHL
jgi:hypothetical protein